MQPSPISNEKAAKKRPSRDWINFCRALPFRYFHKKANTSAVPSRKSKQSDTHGAPPRQKPKVRVDQCEYIVPKKRRRCNLARTPGTKFCGIHQSQHQHTTESRNDKSDTQHATQQAKPQEQPQLSSSSNAGGTSKGKQVPCPHCGDLLREKKLNRHLKKCNAIRRKEKSEAQPYFVRDLHVGARAEDPSTTAVSTFPADKHDCDLVQLERRLKQLFEKCVATVGSIHPMTDSKPQPTFLLGMVGSDQSACREGSTTMKHLHQQSAIIEVLKSRQLLSPSKSALPKSEKTSPVELAEIAVVEFGAARAMLSLDLSAEVPAGSPLVLVERERGIQNTADRLLRRAGFNFQRVTVDIKDLDLRGVNLLRSQLEGDDASARCRFKPFLSVSKHLCGAATDLMLRCVNHYNSSDMGQERTNLCKGGAVALCCHHLCNWRDYVGKDFLRGVLGLNQTDFQRLLQYSHWTSLAEGSSYDAATEEASQMAKHELCLKRQIGRYCKRIIDFGRVAFLRSSKAGYGNAVVLVEYCDAKLTPENCLLAFGGTTPARK